MQHGKVAMVIRYSFLFSNALPDVNLPTLPPSSDFLSRVSSAIATFSMISCRRKLLRVVTLLFVPGASCCNLRSLSKTGHLGVPIKVLLKVISLKFLKEDLQPANESIQVNEFSTESTSAKGKSFFRNSRLGLPNKSKYCVRSL